MYDNNLETQHKESERLDKHSGLRELIKCLRDQRQTNLPFGFW